MSEDNMQMSGLAFGRWALFALLLLVGLVWYFLSSPRVPPIVRSPAAQETP
jgi:hypothetical protein